MRPRTAFAIFAAVLTLLVLGNFNPGAGQNPGKGKGKGDPAQAPRPLPLPDDPKLLALHREFVTEAQKLALEYEDEGEYDKCRDACREILKLVPGYLPAVKIVERVNQRELTAERDSFELQANKDWQSSGIVLQAGKPVAVRVTGKWIFKMSHDVGPDGMTIPDELKKFNLGSVIAAVLTQDPKQEAKPFYIGAGKQWIAQQSGVLYLKMHDSNHADNSGKLLVEVQGTFGRTKK